MHRSVYDRQKTMKLSNRCNRCHEDTCETNSIAMFCCTSPITSDSPLCAASHVPVPGDHPDGAIQAGLRKRRTGWSSGLPGIRRLQSVLNAAARLIYRMRSADPRDPLLPAFTGCASRSGSIYKVAALTYKVLHGSAPQYLGPLVPVADQPGRRTQYALVAPIV